MEQDIEIKNLLAKGAEVASADFTDSIMKKINGLSLNPSFNYQPLVSKKIRKTFVIVFGAVISMIFVLGIIISTPELPLINSINIPQIIFIAYDKVLFFIIAFWLVFAINNVLQKKILKLY